MNDHADMALLTFGNEALHSLYMLLLGMQAFLWFLGGGGFEDPFLSNFRALAFVRFLLETLERAWLGFGAPNFLLELLKEKMGIDGLFLYLYKIVIRTVPKLQCTKDYSSTVGPIE